MKGDEWGASSAEGSGAAWRVPLRETWKTKTNRTRCTGRIPWAWGIAKANWPISTPYHPPSVSPLPLGFNDMALLNSDLSRSHQRRDDAVGACFPSFGSKRQGVERSSQAATSGSGYGLLLGVTALLSAWECLISRTILASIGRRFDCHASRRKERRRRKTISLASRLPTR